MDSKQFLEVQINELRRIKSLIENDINIIEEKNHISLAPLTEDYYSMISTMDDILKRYRIDINNRDTSSIEDHLNDSILKQITDCTKYDLAFEKISSEIVGYSTSLILENKIKICVRSNNIYGICIYIVSYSTFFKSWIVEETITDIGIPCTILPIASDDIIVQILNLYYINSNWTQFKIIEINDKKED